MPPAPLIEKQYSYYTQSFLAASLVLVTKIGRPDMKQNVYTNDLQTIPELKDEIRHVKLCYSSYVVHFH